MRLGKIKFEVSYAVDLDNESMVQEAKNAIAEDVESASRNEDFAMAFDITEDATLTEADIPSFLQQDEE